MNTTFRHLGLLFFDILCIVILWIGFDAFRQTLFDIENKLNVIRFSSRNGFFIVGIGFPLIHLLLIIENYWPAWVKKYKRHINYGLIGLVVILIAAGFTCSSWLKSRAENEGYVNCLYISGNSALSKTLVYAKDQRLCEDFEASKRAVR